MYRNPVIRGKKNLAALSLAAVGEEAKGGRKEGKPIKLCFQGTGDEGKRVFRHPFKEKLVLCH